MDDIETDSSFLVFLLKLSFWLLLGEEYFEIIDEFMAAIHLRWPRALIQHEDFQTKHAVNLLKRYRSDYLMFNDDIQGTAATVLAGIYGALKVSHVMVSDIMTRLI